MQNFQNRKEDTTRNKILKYLLLNRTSSSTCCTVERIAEALGLSQNAIRQHLTILQKEELVFQSTRKSKSGRPAKLFSMHPKAFDLFPKHYPDFSVKLIGAVKKKYGESQILDILRSVGKSIISEIDNISTVELENKPDSKTLNARLELISDFYKKYGKFPELIEEEHSFVLKNFNCLLFEMAKADPLICNVDETILGELLGQKAVKEQCIRDGDPCCLYRIK
ncbi:MAG: helix-turn-helix transcriptional regulator, partial [Candidatus Hodarchaeales archaeon]